MSNTRPSLPPLDAEPLTPLFASLADRYRVERELGAGGMATVYLAHDIRHDRKVALKVLKPELAAVIGATRFLAEIKTTANLHHPNILSLHDSGECAGTVFYVMPFVEGESLRDRLDREKQLPVAEAVRIAVAVAGALQYAHTHGVIHRDVKPENILLHDGHAVVADFGIALAASSAGTRMTQTGMSLGTPHYMSPEQAMGERDLDARTDVYALGCVLYEMLTGQPPFTGATAQAIVAKVITEKAVPPSTLRSSVPEALDDAILTSLEKLPADRFNSASEFASAVGGASTAPHATRARATPVRRNPWPIIAGVFVVATLVLGGMLMRTRTNVGDAGAPVVYDVALPDSAPLSFFGARGASTYGLALTNISVTSRGDFVVYAAAHGDSTLLHTRSLRTGDVTPIPGTGGGSSAKVSPDGAYVAYVADNKVMVTRLAGGTPRQLLVVGPPATLQWISPRQFVALHTDGNHFAIIDVETGPVKQAQFTRCTFGVYMPATNEMLCSLNGIVFTVDVATSKRTVIRVRNADGSVGADARGRDFRPVGDKYVVFVESGELKGASYDASTHTIGQSVSLVTGVRTEGAGPAQYDIAANGTLVYAMGADAELARMVSLHRGGVPEALPVEMGRYKRFDLSPDRRWLAAEVAATQGDELRVYNMKNGQGFTWLRSATIRHALWNRDGTKLLVYVTDTAQSAILYGAPSSAALPETLFKARQPAVLPQQIDFPDDHMAIAINSATDDIFRFDPTARPAHFDSLGIKVRFGTVAPGAKLFGYQAPDGRILVTAFPPSTMRYQIAAAGVEPLWLSSSELLYRAGVTWMLARVNPSTGEPSGSPVVWGADQRFTDTPGWSNRASHDGGIIYAQGPEVSTAHSLRVVPNWTSRMKAAVDSANAAARAH